MKLSARYGVVAALLALAGCSTTAQGPQSSTLAPQDLNFITTAYQLVHFDLDACTFVQKNTLEPQVVPVVNKICADAMEYAPKIRAQAAENNVTLPNTLPTELKAQLVTLNYRPEPNLSVAFIRAEISSHESALAVFQDEAQNGVNPTFKQVATQTAPLVEQNLTMLRQALPAGTGE
jgi:putative membrane protein